MSFRVPSQPRIPGKEWARQLCFGDDAASTTSLHGFREVLARIAESASQSLTSAHRDVCEIVESRDDTNPLGEITEGIEHVVVRLDAARGHIALRDIDRPFRVVLMGRTMAGKSTLFEFLSSGDGARIGAGAQRTTREPSVRTLDDLGIEIVDTPGVGAMDGQDDYEIAFTQVPDADLILWVATDQATQEHTGRALRRLADLGKPILVALNCLADIRDEINYFDLLEEPDRIFGGDADGNLAPIRRHLSRAGGRYIDAVPIHAQAAQVAASGTLPVDESAELLKGSRIQSLIEAIRCQRDDTANSRRLVSLADSVRHEILESASEVDTVRVSLRALLAASHGSQAAFEKGAKRRVEDAHNELKAAFAAAITARERWIERVDVDKSDSEINKDWDDELKALRAELDATASEVTQRLGADLKGLALDVADDWSSIDTEDFRDLGGIGEIWGNRAVKVGGRFATTFAGAAGGAKLGAVIGTFIAGPPGAAAGGVIGGIVGSIVTSLLGPGAVDWVADWLFRSPGDIHQRRRQRIHDQLAPMLNELTVKVEAARDSLRAAWLSSIDGELARQTAALTATQVSLDRLSHLAVHELGPAVANIDTELAREILRSNGRARAADALVRATRWRGAGMAVELLSPAFTEMLLFPVTDDVDRILPTRSGTSRSMSALQIIRSLTDQEVTISQMTPDSLAVTLGSEIAAGTREAWQALAKVHTGTTVRVG